MNTMQHGSYGGIMFPLEMFRPSAMAQLIGEYFVAKARNVLDAELVLTRHPTAQLILLQIHGSVLGEDEGRFWKDHSDLVMLLSRALPLQTFLFYVIEGQERTEGLVVAQGGQALMADEVTPEQLGPDAGPEAWPLARLCQQIGIDPQELAEGVPSGPSIRVPLLEPSMAQDESLLRELMAGLGAPPEEVPGDAMPNSEGASPGASAGVTGAAGPSAGSAGADSPAPRRAASPKAALAEDAKRRSDEKTAEAQARAEMAKAAQADLLYVQDEQGLVVAPALTLEDADLLSGYLKRKLNGDLPEGLPRDLTSQMQGKSVDIVVKVEFLSEVFLGATPLSRPQFEEQARSEELQGQGVRVLEVQAPRLGRGSLVVADKKRVFVSRDWAQVPAGFVHDILERME